MKKEEKKVPQLRFPKFKGDWEQRKLSDITLKIGSGKTPSGGKNAYVDDGIPLIRSQNINNDRVDLEDIVFIDEETDNSMENSRVFTDDVLLNITGASIGRSAVYRGKDKANVNQHVCIIRPTKDFDSDFIQLNLASNFGQKQIDASQAGGGREGLNFQEIGKMSFMFPSNQEQMKIGVYFNHIDYLITLHQRKLEKIKELKKGMLQKMFPKNGKKVPEIRFKGFTDDWEHRKLKAVLSLLKDGTHGTHQDAEEGPYLLSAKNIKNGQIIIDDSSDRKISEDEFNQIHTKFTLENGDILLTIVGSIGESAILESAGKFTFQRSVAFLRPSEEMTSRFLKTEIESVQFQKELNDRKSQSAQPGVYLGDLSKIPIYVTSKEEQKKIGTYFCHLDHLITLHQRKLEKIKELKKGLLQQMFV